MKMTLQGVREMQIKLIKLARSKPVEAAAALFTEMQVELTEAKKRCPVAPPGGYGNPNVVPGALRASGKVWPPDFDGRNIFVMISFGGPSIPYAIAVHEHLSEHSPPSWVASELYGDGVQWNVPGTGPKFLESTLNESRPHMLYRVGRHLGFEG